MSPLHKYTSKRYVQLQIPSRVNKRCRWNSSAHVEFSWQSWMCNSYICNVSSLVQLLNERANISYIYCSEPLNFFSGSAAETMQDTALTFWLVLLSSYPPSFSQSPPLSLFHSLLFPLWVCSLWKTGDMVMTKQKYTRWQQNHWWLKRNNVFLRFQYGNKGMTVLQGTKMSEGNGRCCCLVILPPLITCSSI